MSTWNAPRIVVPPPGPRARAVIERDRAVVSQNFKKDYPFVIERAYGPVVEDPDGNTYLDFAAGIAVVATGHCHPEVVQAIKAQADRYLHICATDFYDENVVALAEGLTRHAPGPGPWRAFFCNSGAEAVEAAIKLARLRTGRPKLVAFYGAFHGRTYGAMSLTASRPVQRKGYAPLLPEVHHSHYAYCYRCPVGKAPESCSVECLDLLEKTMFGTTLDPSEIAAVIVEPWPPSFHCISSSFASRQPSGMPEAMPLARVTMSGCRSKCSDANKRPVRPIPHCTSSAISTMLCLSHRALSLRRYA